MPRSRRFSLALLLAVGGGLCVYFVNPSGQRRTVPPPPVARDEEPEPVSGHVRAQGIPVVGARVRLKGTPATAVTDAAGHFRLPHAKGGRVTAWKNGHFIAGTSVGSSPLELTLLPLPEADRDDYAWVDPAPDPSKPGNCGNCHGEIYREWAASGHSRSATGRRFRNLYEGTNWNGDPGVGWGLLNDYPVGAGVCASCHAPAIPDTDTAVQLDLRKVSGVATRGVHCDYCHKVADVGDGTVGLKHGRFNLPLLRPASVGRDSDPDKPRQDRNANPRKQLFFGPLDDVDRGEDAYSPLYLESRYCASCHEGVVFGVPVYTTYSEWLDSPARRQGKQCQDCHMAPTGTMTNIAPGRGGIERDPQTLANHRFFAPDQETMLRHCVRVEASARRKGDEVRVTVRIVAENVGHRVPTGFIDRHLILVVDALGADGNLVRGGSGPSLPQVVGPEMAGRPGRLYAKLLTGRDGQAPAPFWLAGADPQDTRLRPDRAEESGWRFSSRTQQLRVRLLYRRFWAETVRGKGWPDRDVTVQDLTILPR
jgi:hypothetical protein